MDDMADIYRETWERMTDVGRSLDETTAAGQCAATPEWSVKDVYAHQAGVAADILAGNLEGVATDPWTARQVAERRDLSLAEVLDEWDATAPQIESLIRSLGDAMDPRLLMDLWTHEQDVRHTLGRPGGRESTAAAFSEPFLVGGYAARVCREGLPAVEVVFGDDTTVAGDGDPVGSVKVARFDFLRAVLGRRSPGETRAWDWSVDPEPYVALIPVFGPRTDPLDEV